MSPLQPDMAVLIGLYVCLFLLAAYGLWVTHENRCMANKIDEMRDQLQCGFRHEVELNKALADARRRLLNQTLRADRLSAATKHAVDRHLQLQTELELARAVAGSGDAARRRDDSDDSHMHSAMAAAMLATTVHGAGVTQASLSDDGVNVSHVSDSGWRAPDACVSVASSSCDASSCDSSSACTACD